ncbi:MAG: HipA N-terminal domain-containing protein [Bacteroidia bacterium]|nr:HipA N-terminal domain-containing protein [Bacteroidia bacterium]MCF8428288.1 HipA N-terminal domain-containing protein [Bacteroidia bacterium]MCF8446842.1 HipA N-terminal domain-containing protein [Bacteroidia bacterium]
MLQKLFNLFSKDDEFEDFIQMPSNQKAKFTLSVDQINVGNLICENGEWYFKYSNEFKDHSNEYKRIIGFPDLDKTYKSDALWPFFQVRIPGLKQPAIREIIENERIDKSDKVELLKRFGQKTISNPYELEVSF